MDLITLSVPFVALVCGGPLSSVSGGNFTSPGYNGIRDYARNLDCEWTVSNPNRENSSINIHFIAFSLESHQDCVFDVLEFRVGEFHQRMCSLIYLLILLSPGDNSSSSNGFYLRAQVTKELCQHKAEIPCSQIANVT